MTTLGSSAGTQNDEEFDNWKGVAVGMGLIGGAPASVDAFALAGVAKLMHERWIWLWLPLPFGPVFLLSVPLWFE